METELRRRGAPQTNGTAAPTIELPAARPESAATRNPFADRVKHGKAMQILRGVSLALYFFLSCVA